MQLKIFLQAAVTIRDLERLKGWLIKRQARDAFNAHAGLERMKE